MWGTSDNLVFAGIPFTGAEGTFTCRLVALSNVSCPQPSTWTKVGLMARGDLSDDAPMANLEVTGANGIAHSRGWWRASRRRTRTAAGGGRG